ncbi:hypothetical protein HMPREF1051_2364 [Neisseria sicca VK64]|uniref:Uncharacterized protein n=1 Tax=Neisseria sicca VK64 TaxID=1095748 RepID=I2NLD0_NEISI|nr:hypothetical protein HMPREF1051_2364 [Neisseria sicca VK64]
MVQVSLNQDKAKQHRIDFSLILYVSHQSKSEPSRRLAVFP